MILPSEQDNVIGNYDTDLQPKTDLGKNQDKLKLLQAYKDGDISLDEAVKEFEFFAHAFHDNPKTHETFLIGFNPDGSVIFFKSYDYIKQKTQAQTDATWVQNNCDHWEFGAASEFKIIHENLTHHIIIPHP